MSAQRDRHGQPMYGGLHKAVRRRFAARMRVGEVFHCWRAVVSDAGRADQSGRVGSRPCRCGAAAPVRYAPARISAL